MRAHACVCMCVCECNQYPLIHSSKYKIQSVMNFVDKTKEDSKWKIVLWNQDYIYTENKLHTHTYTIFLQTETKGL